MAENEPSVTIGNVQGSAVAVGKQSRATNTTHHGAAADPETEELRKLVKELRTALAMLAETPRTAELGRELAETEREIDRTGRAGATRRERLRALLADSQSVVSLVTSAASLAALLGR